MRDKKKIVICLILRVWQWACHRCMEHCDRCCGQRYGSVDVLGQCRRWLGSQGRFKDHKNEFAGSVIGDMVKTVVEGGGKSWFAHLVPKYAVMSRKIWWAEWRWRTWIVCWSSSRMVPRRWISKDQDETGDNIRRTVRCMGFNIWNRGVPPWKLTRSCVMCEQFATSCRPVKASVLPCWREMRPSVWLRHIMRCLFRYILWSVQSR